MRRAFSLSRLIHHRCSKTLASEQKPRYIVFMNLFHCVFCDNPVDPDQAGTAHLITAWVRVGKTAVMKVQEKQYQYAHAICVEAPGKKEQTETLF